jgi:hypothetical protein
MRAMSWSRYHCLPRLLVRIRARLLRKRPASMTVSSGKSAGFIPRNFGNRRSLVNKPDTGSAGQANRAAPLES